MIKVDLITGFLGSGKTTFLKEYASHFINKGLKIGILENDYGAVNVDMLMLNSLRSDNCELEMVAGGCDADCHKRRFKSKLISMGMSGYDRVIIEPSGIFDVDELFDVLEEDPVDRWYEIGNIITIVDCGIDENMSEEARFFLASQTAVAGLIIFSKTQLYPIDNIAKVKNIISEACAEFKVHSYGKNVDYLEKSYSDFTLDDWNVIENSGYRNYSCIKVIAGRENDFKTLYFLESGLTLNKLKEVINKLYEAPDVGNIIRIKGYIIEDGKWFEINATRNECVVNEVEIGQEVFIVIGEKLLKDKIQNIIENL